MKRLLLRLYPDWWRERYGDEFAALLEDRPVGPWDIADVMFGAIDARRRGHRKGNAVRIGRGSTMSTRTWGFAAMSGGLLWSTGLFGVTFDPTGRPWSIRTMFAALPWPWPALAAMVLGMVLLLIAVVGLSALQGRQHPRLIWAAVAATAVGISVPLCGLIGIQLFGNGGSVSEAIALDSAWTIWQWGVLTIAGGSALFAFATWRARVYSRVGALIILAASILMIATLLGGASNVGVSLMKASWWLASFFVGLFAFASGWIWLGWGAATRTGTEILESTGSSGAPS